VNFGCEFVICIAWLSSIDDKGTREDYETAVFTQERFKEYGIASEIQPVPVLLSSPISRSLELISPSNQRYLRFISFGIFQILTSFYSIRYAAKMQEAPIGVDPTSSDPRVVMTFNGYAPSGDVTAELV